MARTLLVISLFVGSDSLFLGCTQDFNAFKPGAGGAGTTSTSSSGTTSTVSTSSSSSTGTGGAPQCTDTDLSKCDDMNICTTESCVAGQCKNTPVTDGLAPGYVDTPTDCVDDVCKAGVLTKNAPDDTEIPDDMNTCTADTCVGGAPMHAATNEGMPCGTPTPPQKCVAGQCVGCANPIDCGTDTYCQGFTCSAQHVCGTMNLHEGMATPTGQTTGDCHTVNCVAGTPTPQVDDTDKPVDGNVCTQDVCTNGVATNPAENMAHLCGTGASCSADKTQGKLADHCNGAGACSTQTLMNCTPNFNCTNSACNTMCTDATHCLSGFVCDTTSHTCVECTSTANCTAPQVCDTTPASALLDTCVECTASTTCMAKLAPEAKVCQPSGTHQDQCACAADGDCVNNFVGACNVATGQCGCMLPADCLSNNCLGTHLCGP